MTARPPKDTLDTLEGRTLGEFALREKIGEGGFATVHRAFQSTLDREAVVKVLHTRLASRTDVIQRFLREARMASRLDHPYAAHVYAFGAEPDGTLWIAMELVRGTPMDKLLEQQGALPLDRFVPLFERICEVVQTAHERGIVHRDLKPANVMVLSRAGRLLPKLLDFGIARVLDDARVAPADTDDAASSDDDGGDQRPTRAGAVMGSPLYMAPEQWSDASAVGPAVDIYALGVLAYETLAGRVPFPATSLHDVMIAHATEAPPPLGGQLPAALDAVIARALAKEPTERYATAGDLAAAIAAATGRSTADALPQLDDSLRDAMAAGAPQPLAEAVAALEAARNIDQACAIVWDVVRVSTHWIGMLALAARSKIGPGGDDDPRDVQERLRALGRGDVGDEDWLLLARALTRPFVRKRDAYPIPELIELLHGDVDLAVTPTDIHALHGPAFVEAFQKIRTVRGALDRRGGRSDEQRRELYAEALATLAGLLRPLRFVLDYTLIVTRNARAERWRGLRRSPRPAVVRRARPLPDGEAYLIDLDGQPVLKLAPLVQVAPPAPGKDDELFLFDGRRPQGARLVAVPYGFERHDPELDDWFRDNLFDLVEGTATVADEIAPYRGLATFTSADSSFYFGREKEVDAFVNRLRGGGKSEPFLAVVGPSGVGKSSFVQAGVIPRLPTNWRAIVMRPGMAPAAALAARLARHGVDTAGAGDARALVERLRATAAREGSTIVLVVDQLEELFTLCKDAGERSAFADALVAAVTSDEDPVRVVVTLRDDFLIRAEGEPALRERLARGLKLLTTPTPEDLERILVEPARRVGYQFEDRSLVTEMVTEVAGQPGALALLSFTAAELWKLRDRHFQQLSRKSYTAIGGVAGALAQHAEATLAGMSPDEQRLAREAFRHLVTSEGTRQVLELAELQQLLAPQGKGRASTDSDVMRGNAVIDHLVAARLLVVSEEGGEDQRAAARVEIVHETLIATWPRLGRWVREDAESARMRDQLRAAARQWQERERPGGLLWRGDVLADLERWRRRDSVALTEAERAFADASRREATRARRIRRVLVVVAFAGLSIALTVTLWLSSQAKQERARAVRSLAALHEEQGRQALLAGQSGRALIYFEEASKLGADSPALQLMIGLAIRPLQAREATLGHGNKKVWSVAYTPDGNRIVSGGEDGTTRIWDARTGAPIATLSDGPGEIIALAISPDGRFVATASTDQHARIWDVGERRVVARLAHGGAVLDVEFSPDGARVLTAAFDRTAAIWDARSGQQLAKLTDANEEVIAAMFSTDGTSVITAGTTASVWDAQTGARRATFTASPSLELVAVARDGKRAVVAGAGGAWILNPATGADRTPLIGHVDSIEMVEFSPDSARVVTASSDRSARIWDAATGRLLVSLLGHDGAVRVATFAPGGDRVATVGDDGQVRLWDARHGVLLATYETNTGVRSAMFSRDGTRIATAGWNGQIAIWNAAASHLLAAFDGGGGGGTDGTSVDVSADGGLVAGGTQGARLSVLDRRTPGSALVSAATTSTSFSGDGRRIVTAELGATKVWDRDGRLIATLPHARTLHVAIASPDGRTVATSSRDVLQLWNVDRGAVDATLERGRFARIAFSPDGRLLAAGHADGSTTLYLDGRVSSTLVGPSGWVNSVAFSRDGRRIVTTHQQPIAIVWDVATGDMIGKLEGHARNVLAAVFSTDGALIATGADDRTVKLWDAAELRLLASFDTSSIVAAIAITADGQLVGAGVDGQIWIWRLDRLHHDLDEVTALARCHVPLVIQNGRPVANPTDPARCRSR